MADFSDVQAVVFDAVGTLIYPSPSVADAYRHALAKYCGVEADCREINRRLAAALAARSDSDDLSTSEDAERNFWAGLIREFCPRDDGFQACFDALYRHFASPSNWRCFDDVEETLSGLQSRGLTVALASNFDHRLHEVSNGLKELEALECRLVSSEVGWRKPAPQFFAKMEEQLQCSAHQILMVGDDPANDITGSLARGMHAALIDRLSGTAAIPESAMRLASLCELLEIDTLRHHSPRAK